MLTLSLRPDTPLAELAERLLVAGADGRLGALTYVAVRVGRAALRAA
ncbi:MAG: hypothetical protein WDO24_16780 [Pseudomonadota bacterium]